MATATQPRFPADQANSNGKPKTVIVLDASTPLAIAAKQCQEGNVDLGSYVEWLKSMAQGTFAEITLSACRILSDTDLREVLSYREARMASAKPQTADYAWSVSSGGHATLTVKGSKGGSNTTTMSVASWRGLFKLVGAPADNAFDKWIASAPSRDFAFEHYKKSTFKSTQRLFADYCAGKHAHHAYVDMGANVVKVYLDLGAESPTVPESLRARVAIIPAPTAANPLAGMSAEQIQSLLAALGK
jgi:hypothetical protein